MRSRTVWPKCSIGLAKAQQPTHGFPWRRGFSCLAPQVKAVPLNRILLETDGPYMAPVPHRGKAAHPGHVPYIAQQVAEVKGVPLEEVLHTVRDNTRTVYGI